MAVRIVRSRALHRRRGPGVVLVTWLLALILAGCGAVVQAPSHADVQTPVLEPTDPPVAASLVGDSGEAAEPGPTDTVDHPDEPLLEAESGPFPSGPAESVQPTAAPTIGQPTAEPSARPMPRPSRAVPARRAFALNLYRSGDFVRQYTFEWCVGASLQMTLNMIRPGASTSRTRQQALWATARDLSSSPFGGANPIGWTAALNELGVGPYVLVSIPDFDEALRVAAGALRETRRPVGLVMWRGRHAWVMSGFTSDADPRVHDDFRVTGVRVLDPLYPHGNRRWGPSPRPNTLMRPTVLARQFVIRDRGRVNLGVPPGYLLILPTSLTPA